MDAILPHPFPEALLHSALNQVREHAIVLLDSSARIVAWLGAAEGMFGYTPDEILGQPLDLLFTPEDRALQVPRHELDIAVATGRGENDRWLMRKDGTRIWADGVSTALHDETGRLIGYCKIMRDRTDIKTQVETLEHRAQSAAASVQRSRVFLATLAHELRNPLGALSNGLQILRLSTDSGSDRVKKALEIYERQLGAMRRLLDDLTDTVRADTGKLALDLKPVEVNDLLRMASLACQPRAQDKGQRFEVLELPVGVLVNVDADRMQQVLVNLLENAIKYTPREGSVWLKATTEGDEAVFRVLDTGIGMAEEALPRVFDLFTQEEAPQGQMGSGLGLGLALVKQLVELHGGTVTARSGGRDQGSEFTVRLRRHE